MKFTKMSLVAMLLIGSSAFAIENTKVSGNAKLYYDTTSSQLAKDSSSADAALNLNVKTDLVKNDFILISAGAGYTVLSTLGLENNLVSKVWGGAHTATAGTGATYGKSLGGAKVENANWVNEAWIAATAGKTALKIGRMALDTPLVFTETWSIEKNTFESAVVINQDIPNTTLVGAFVGNGNGTEVYGQKNLHSNVDTLKLATAAVVNGNGKFGTFGTDGAYAVGVINNSFKPLTVQAWYYDLTRLATAYWLQADLKCKKVPGLLAGAQYASLSVKDGNTLGIANTDASSTYAFMLGYEVKNIATIKLAYSSVDSKGVLTAQNTATSSGASKLYTEAWWNYGKVTQLDTDSYHVSVEGKAANIDLALLYTNANQSATAGNNDLSEVTFTAGRSFGPLDVSVAVISAQITTNNVQNTVNRGQAYLTLNF